MGGIFNILTDSIKSFGRTYGPLTDDNLDDGEPVVSLRDLIFMNIEAAILNMQRDNYRAAPRMLRKKQISRTDKGINHSGRLA